MTILQTHLNGRWRDAAEIEFLEPEKGVAGRTRLSYLPGYVTDVAAAELLGEPPIDLRAVSVNHPVDLVDRTAPHWPAFLLDFLPQGANRTKVAAALGLPAHGRASDLPILLRAGGSPVGNVRIKGSTEADLERAGPLADRGRHLVRLLRGEAFDPRLAEAALAATGSLGLQGEWPKLALTAGADGAFRPDPLVPDDEACLFAILKTSRSRALVDAAILGAEAVYSQLAKAIGLDVPAPAAYGGGALVSARFDRRVTETGVERLGQESLVSALGVAAFGFEGTHEAYLARIAAVSSEPEADVLEYLLRDVAALAMGDPDNHGRNAALLKHADGTIRLAPLFDFAPMRLSGQGIMRSTRWACMRGNGSDSSPDWRRVVDAAEAATGVDADVLADGLKRFAAGLAEVPAMARSLGLPDGISEIAMSRCGAISEAVALNIDRVPGKVTGQTGR